MMISFAAAAPLRSRDFRLFFLGQWISQLGDNLFMVAQTWLVWNLTGSGAAMATVMLCSQLPAIAMILLGGALVDRLPRRWVSIASDIMRGACLLTLAGLVQGGLLRPWHLYMLAGLFGLVSAFARPAFAALVQGLVAPEERTPANALIATGSTIAGVAGPALGGIIMGFGGAGLAFTLNGLSFLVAAVALLMAAPEAPLPKRAGGGMRLPALMGDLREALRLLSGQRFLLGTIAVMAVINVTGQAPVIMLRPWGAEHAGGGVSTLSIAYTSFALGMALTVAVLSSLKIARQRGLLSYGGIAVAGLCELGMAYTTAPWQFWLLQFLLGGAVMVYGVLWESMLQGQVPPEAMGRVAAIDQFGSLVLYPAGIALTGMLAAGVGAAPVMAVGGVLTAVIAGMGMVAPWVRAQH